MKEKKESHKSNLYVCFVGMLLFCMYGLSGESIDVRFQRSSDAVTQFRYQVNAELPSDWIVVDLQTECISLEDFVVDKDILYIQQSIGDGDWGRSYPFIYDLDTGCWEVDVNEQSMISQKMDERNPDYVHQSLELRGRYLHPFALCSDYYGSGFGGRVKINFMQTNREHLHYHTSLFYQRLSSKTNWVSNFHDIGLTFGIDVPIVSAEILSIVFELDGGAILHLVDGDVEGDGSQALSLFVDPLIAVSTTFLVGREGTLQLVISPGLSWFFEKEALGQKVSLEAGLRVGL